MAHRYSISSSQDQLEQRFGADPTSRYKPRFNAAPTQLLPIITNISPQGLSFFYWGIDPQLSKNKTISQKLYNTEAETITQKASFRNAFRSRRCLVPADGYYAWKTISRKGKIPYRIHFKDDRLFSIAGLWEEYENPQGELSHSFTIITTPSNKLMGDIQERMPVIFGPEEEKVWLSFQTPEEELLKLLSPANLPDLHYYPVSPLVNSLNQDSPKVLTPTQPADQFGNYTLFD